MLISLARLSKLFENFFLWATYRHQFIALVIRGLTKVSSLRLHELALSMKAPLVLRVILILVIRKNASGFVHDRIKYFKKPSVATLCTMNRALTIDYLPIHKRMVKKRYEFRKYLGEQTAKWYTPWDRSEGESAPYYHCRVDV